MAIDVLEHIAIPIVGKGSIDCCWVTNHLQRYGSVQLISPCLREALKKVWGGAPAEGPGGGDTLGWGHPKRLNKAPTDYTKPQNMTQSTRNTILDKT